MTAQSRALVLATVAAAGQPLDAYQVARRTGLSAMAAARTLDQLAATGAAAPVDDLAEFEVNPLAARWRKCARPAAAMQPGRHTTSLA